MARLVIDFEGLVCHVGNPKTHAVLIHEPTDHRPEIEAGELTLALNQWDTVWFEGPRPGAVHTDPTFDRRVLMLSKEIKNGGIFEDILTQTHALPSVAAYVVYPAGTLSAPRAHPYKLKVTRGTATPVIQCVAMGVRFESEEVPTEKVTIVIQHHNELGEKTNVDRFDFPTETKVLINNISDVGNHFYHYLRLTSANVISKVAESLTVCNAESEDATAFTAKVRREQEAFANLSDPLRSVKLAKARETFASVNPECTNSQWP